MTHPTTHHEFGPSSLSRRSKCPASYILEKDIPELVCGEAAVSGKLIHAAIESYIESGTTPSLDNIEDQKKAEDCIDFLEKYKAQNDITDTHAEMWVSANDLIGTIYSGTADVIMLSSNGDLHIIDWKTGFNKVEEAECNWQGRAYALAAMQSFGKEKCKVTFFNPSIKQVTSAEFSNKEEIIRDIEGVISNCQKELPDCNPGEEQCRYCKGALTGTCNAWRRWSDFSLKVNHDEELEIMKDSELVALYDACLRTAKYCELIKREITRRFNERQTEICGYIVKERSGLKKVNDVQMCYDCISDIVPLPEFLKCVKVDLAQLGKSFFDCLKMKYPGDSIKAKDSQRKLEELLGDNIKRQASSQVLAKV